VFNKNRCCPYSITPIIGVNAFNFKAVKRIITIVITYKIIDLNLAFVLLSCGITATPKITGMLVANKLKNYNYLPILQHNSCLN
jgi:hypothetical protein